MEEKRDLEEAMVEEEAVMEGEVEAGEVTVEVAEVEGEDMAVEAEAVAMDGEADTAAKAVAVEAPNAIGAQYLWKKARRLTSQLIQLVGEATASPASTTL